MLQNEREACNEQAMTRRGERRRGHGLFLGGKGVGLVSGCRIRVLSLSLLTERVLFCEKLDVIDPHSLLP